MSRPGTHVKLVPHQPLVPHVADVHDAGILLAAALDEMKQAEANIEAVGMGLYRLVPIDMVAELALEDQQEMV